MGLYTAGGRRRILPPLVFGLGVFLHLLRHGRRYDVVDTCAFPYFSLLAAALLRPLMGYELIVDWFEVWSDSYWREYLGPVGGRVGMLVQRLCARVPQRAYCFSELHARRLREEGLRGSVTVLRGLWTGQVPPRVDGDDERSAEAGAADEPGAAGATEAAAGEPLVLFAARLIPEKQVTLAIAAIALATERIDGLRGMILGDGPDRAALTAAIAEHGLQRTVSAPGFADAATVEREMASAMCLLLTSRREGYGMVVVEAAAHGTPSVVVAGEENAATELIVEGVNGTVAAVADPRVVADAIVRLHRAGPQLRRSTSAWFAENASSLSLAASLETVLEGYASARA